LASQASNAVQFAATETAARALALEAEVIEVRVADELERVFEDAQTKHAEASIVLSSPLYSSLRSKSGNPAVSLLMAEPERDVPKMRGLRREDPAWCQTK
jgi:hypothetical protein